MCRVSSPQLGTYTDPDPFINRNLILDSEPKPIYKSKSKIGFRPAFFAGWYFQAGNWRIRYPFTTINISDISYETTFAYTHH